ncbi:LuxR family two component transcriptional regulator [Streptomyces sp. 1114.5]|uniref:response regulator transcription factor n=1 Tax=unclassified Streptomyces TaxID=2593676 RepID=UPI000BCFABE8|nr:MULTISPECIES: response regulator transcription factor [unclassified Streptomyces]RKT08791.1 LuxR family two component transcriptional regulator [Streptomyces sp. 1114.5]SOB79060.1 two component transcriptional regulator, LuxR family [Streptomyces sp. 1331.2]
MTIRVLLADDQALLRGAFRLLIDAEEDMEVVGEAADGREAVELARATKPDIVLMDIRMPGADGLGATAEICGDEQLSGTRVLILTTFEIDEYVAQALRAGAGGFLGKGADPKELLAAVRTVAAGEALLSPAATRAVIDRFLAQPETTAAGPVSERLSVLTAREREVMSMAATGLTNEEIAERMFVSPFTVRTHVHRAMAKLDARDRAQLVAIAYQSGLVPPGRPS